MIAFLAFAVSALDFRALGAFLVVSVFVLGCCTMAEGAGSATDTLLAEATAEGGEIAIVAAVAAMGGVVVAAAAAAGVLMTLLRTGGVAMLGAGAEAEGIFACLWRLLC